MAAGDYLHWQFQFTRKNVDRSILAADTSAAHADIIVPKTANHRIYIQKITFSPTTYAAQTITFRDGAGAPVPIGFMSVPATAPTTGGDCQYVLDYGPTGTPLTVGEELDVILSAAGIAGRLHIEAYEKLELPIAIGNNN
jgi:hypothetical protein